MWLLSLLQLLRLLGVSLLQLLGLLLVSLLHLLRSRLIRLLFRLRLVFLVLFLLEDLPILALLREELVLLLLVLLVLLRVSCVVRSDACDGRQVLGMDCEARPWSGTNQWRTVVRRHALLGGIAGRPRVLNLIGHRWKMSTMSRRLFLGRGAFGNAAVSAVVADVVHCGVVRPGVVHVVDEVRVDVIPRRVVEEMPPVPAPAFIATTEVTEAIIDPPVETD